MFTRQVDTWATMKASAGPALRGNLAAWALIAFGAIYGAWGLRRAYRGRVHTHRHAHADGHFHNLPRSYELH